MIKEKGFDIIISSDIQYEELCAEIYFNQEFVAIITQENGIENAVIEIPPHAKNWAFNCVEFMNIVIEARNCLIKMKKL